MRTFSKYYTFDTIEVRIFWYEDDHSGALRANASIQPASDPIPSDKPIGQRIGGALRGALDRATQQQRDELLTKDELSAAKAALVALATALGLEKREKAQ